MVFRDRGPGTAPSQSICSFLVGGLAYLEGVWDEGCARPKLMHRPPFWRSKSSCLVMIRVTAYYSSNIVNVAAYQVCRDGEHVRTRQW